MRLIGTGWWEHSLAFGQKPAVCLKTPLACDTVWVDLLRLQKACKWVSILTGCLLRPSPHTRGPPTTKSLFTHVPLVSSTHHQMCALAHITL